MNQEIEGLREANILVKAGKPAEAFPILKRILKTNKDNKTAWFLLASCVNKPEDKIFCFKEIIRINPNDKEAKKVLESIESKETIQPLANRDLLSEIPETKNIPTKEIEESSMPNVFNIIGVIILFFGLFAGLSVGQPTSFLDSFNWQLTFIVWLSAFISGMIFFGIGKIIELLVKIVNKL
jgi:hypothetical protein